VHLLPDQESEQRPARSRIDRTASPSSGLQACARRRHRSRDDIAGRGAQCPHPQSWRRWPSSSSPSSHCDLLTTRAKTPGREADQAPQAPGPRNILQQGSQVRRPTRGWCQGAQAPSRVSQSKATDCVAAGSGTRCDLKARPVSSRPKSGPAPRPFHASGAPPAPLDGPAPPQSAGGWGVGP